MRHEPSYVSGTRFFPELGVYGGWVAHEGSFAARVSSPGGCDDVAILFSGECFPTGRMRDPSAAPDEREGECDVIRLRRAYNEEGDRFVGQLNGLFGGLAIDRRRKRALLFNDRYGIERIYLFEKDGATFFASEAKALLAVLPELRVFDDEGVAQFLNFGCTLDGRTLFRGLRFLPGGSLWVFENGASAVAGRYFSPEEWESQPGLAEEAFESAYIETFRRILPKYLSSESRLGIALTGGLDTRMIMACVPAREINSVCYTFAGLTGETLDARLAARVARACGLEHHNLRIGPDFLSDFGRHVDRTVFATDGTAGVLDAHEIYLNALARQLSPVRVTGNYGSEILRSMSTFKPVALDPALVNQEFSRTLAGSAHATPATHVHPVTHAAFREVPWHLFGNLAAGRSQLTFRTPYLDNEIVGLAFRAPPSARRSPRAALRLVNENNPGLARIPTDRGQAWGSRGAMYLARRIAAEATFKLDYLHKQGLPHWLSPFDPLIGSLSWFGLLGWHKFLAYRIWLRRELAGYVRGVLNDSRTRQLPYWNSPFLSSVVADHVAGRRNYIREIHAVLTLEAVERTLIRGFGGPDVRGSP